MFEFGTNFSRYIYICHPTTARTMCTVPKVNRAILTLFIASISVQISRFFDAGYENVWCQTDDTNANQIVPACAYRLASWISEPDLYFMAYYGFRILFVNLAPCIALVILNVLLFLALKVSVVILAIFDLNHLPTK